MNMWNRSKFMCGHLFSVLLTAYLEMELLGHTLSFSLTFWRTAKLLSKAAAPVFIPASSVQELPIHMYAIFLSFFSPKAGFLCVALAILELKL